MSDLQKRTVVQDLSSVAQDLLNKTLKYLPIRASENIYRLELSMITAAIPVVTYLAWSYITQPTKQKKRPAPVTTTQTATINAEQTTPQDQSNKLNSEHIGQFAPRYSNMTDSPLYRAYRNILREDLSITPVTLNMKRAIRITMYCRT